MTTNIIPLGDRRSTTYTVQTVEVREGTCTADHGNCGKPGVIAVRVTIDQQSPNECSTLRMTMCAAHRGDAARLHEQQVVSAREMQDPVRHAAFLAAAGITD
ncbi:hypothetical protein ACIQH0_13285 [Streptomyces griseus]|uniref:hypothetical protein n=1 Tax=Streptomyces griseus TaxID=1911 RepID=UPI0038109AB3